MGRVKKPNTATIELIARVPKGVSAREFRRLFTWQHTFGELVLYPDDTERFGETLHFRIGRASIKRKAKARS